MSLNYYWNRYGLTAKFCWMNRLNFESSESSHLSLHSQHLRKHLVHSRCSINCCKRAEHIPCVTALLFKGLQTHCRAKAIAAPASLRAVEEARRAHINFPATVYQRDAYLCSSSIHHFSTTSLICPEGLVCLLSWYNDFTLKSISVWMKNYRVTLH